MSFAKWWSNLFTKRCDKCGALAWLQCGQCYSERREPPATCPPDSHVAKPKPKRRRK